MAVVRVTLETRKGGDAVGAKQNYDRTYSVVTDSAEDDENVVLAADGIPPKYATHPSDRRALVKSREAAQSATDAKTWSVSVRYDTEPIAERDRQRDEAENPLERPVEISWDYGEDTEFSEFDAEGEPFQTANGEAIDPGLESPELVSILTIVKNQETFTASDQLEYGNTVNESTFYGAPAGKGRMLPMRAQRVVEGDYTYWRVTYTVQFREKGWEFRTVHKGYLVRNDDDEILRAEDDFGNPTDVQVLLDADGKRLAPAADPVFLTFTRFLEKDWSPLGLEE